MKKIFIANARTPDAPLPEILGEILDIEEVLLPLQAWGVCDLVSIREADLDDVCHTFSKKDGPISIFHYAGHANQQELHLEGGGRSKGLAELFGLTQGDALGLVFLNGCATEGHVENLHAAGVQAVIATSRKVNDTVARAFAVHFYKTWANMAGTTLEEAFQSAKASAHTTSEGEHLDIEIAPRSFGRAESTADVPLPWRLYLNPSLDDDHRQVLLNWQLNPSMPLEPQLLDKLNIVPSENMREVAYTFCQTDAEARQWTEAGTCTEMTALIRRLPWVVGTHLRRLYALDVRQAKRPDAYGRLRELVAAYTELTRFICFTALSALWEGSPGRPQRAPLPMSGALPVSEQASHSPDYIYYLTQYHRLLLDLPGDPLQIKAHTGAFLSKANGGLQSAYRYMESLKVALSFARKKGEQEAMALFAKSNNLKNELDEICQLTEYFFGQFVEAAFFLTHYKLYSVRAISVDKVRYLDVEAPFGHKIISLHAAFGAPESRRTERKVAGDNYSILLVPRTPEGSDLLENTLSLSPFYIDKHALLSDTRDSAPAIFVLKHENTSAGKPVYTYEYLDTDINHTYHSKADHRLHLALYGLQGHNAAVENPLGNKKDPKTEIEENLRFRAIYRQIEKLKQHFDEIL